MRLCYLLIAVLCALFLSGCFLEFALVEEGAVASLAEEGAGLGIAEEAAELGVAEEGLTAFELEDALMSESDRALLALEERNIIGGTITAENALIELENVRLIERGYGKPPQLRFINNGSEPFAEVVNKRVIRFLDGKGEIYLNNDVCAIKGDNVTLRSNPTTDVSTVKSIIRNSNRKLVLKLGEQDGWYKVMVDRKDVGWIKANFLIPVIIADSSDRHLYPRLDRLRSLGYTMKVYNHRTTSYYINEFFKSLGQPTLSDNESEESKQRRSSSAEIKLKSMVDSIRFDRIFTKDVYTHVGFWDINTGQYYFHPFGEMEPPPGFEIAYPEFSFSQDKHWDYTYNIYIKNYQDFTPQLMEPIFRKASGINTERLADQPAYVRFYYSMLDEKYQREAYGNVENLGLFCYVYLIEVWGDKAMRNNRLAVLYPKSNPPLYLKSAKELFYSNHCGIAAGKHTSLR